jgi:signal transduction histidine kinase
MLHDLTEEKRAEKLKSEFVSAVSHELRTPLTSIRGALGLMVAGIGGAIPEKSMAMLKIANENAIRLTTLINDLLDFEKLEYGGIQFNFEHLSLIVLLENSIRANQGFAQSFNVTTRFDRSANDDVIVRVDAQRFVQVLSNLLSNAIKFSSKNGQIDIRIKRINESVRVEIQDYGIGISEKFRNSIFQKFSQEDAKSSRKYSGTGLGLSLAKSMIEKMQGEIGYSSVEGEGSIFYVELPIPPQN